MASIRDYAFTEGTVAATSVQPDMPVHQTNDLLIAFCNADAVGFGTAPTDWVEMYSADAGAHGYAVYYKIATSSNETPTINLASSETHTITVVAVRDVDTTTPINTNDIRSTDDSTNPFDGVGLTTTSTNCLLFSFLGTDGGLGPTCAPPWTNLVNGDAGVNSGGLAYTVKKASGSVPAPIWWGQINENTISITVAINDDGNLSTLSPYIQQDTTNGVFLEPGYVTTGANAWGNTWQSSLSLATIGSKTAAGDAATLQADQGLNPYWGVAACTPTASTNGSTVGGPQLDFGTAQDLTGGITLFNYFFLTSRDYVDISKTTDSGQVGLLFVTRDASNNYKAWSVGAKETVTTKPDGYNITAIQVDQSTDTRYASSGTQNNSAVASVLSLAQGRYGAVAFRWGNLVIAYEQAIAGGTVTTPLGFDNIEILLNTSIGQQRIMLREGSAATFVAPLKFGGTDPVHISINLRTLQYRTQSDGVDYLDWHVDDLFCGFEFDGQANDTIEFANCVFVSGSPTYWRFSSDHSASANINFSGTTIINQNVTLRSTVSLDNVAFISCNEIILNDADILSASFSNQRIGANSGAVAFTSASEGSGIVACEFIDNNDGDLGHSIRITATGTYTFDEHSFSGGGVTERNFLTSSVNEGADTITTDSTHGYSNGDAVYYQDQGGSVNMGLTDGNLYYVRAPSTTTLSFYPTKADATADTNIIALTQSGSETHYIYSAKADVYNNSGGAITINVINGGDTPSIRNSNGSSTTINNAVVLRLTVKDEAGFIIQNARAAIYRTSDDTELMNELTNASGIAETTYNYSEDTDIYIRVRKSSTGDTKYQIYSSSDTITPNGFSSTVTMTEDTVVS